jgi:condensin complex subunit 1
MLHLIWTKDNSTSTSEDGKEIKGVRQRLLECYKSLYFDPLPDPEMDAHKQVSRIAKNFVEYVSISYLVDNRLSRPRLTYEATLAELTSLEEMMRIMMEEGHVHQDIIYRLWQIYGRFFLKWSKYSSDMT